MRLYEALLRLYPVSFREEYGGEMRAIFARRWRQHPRSAARCLQLAGAAADVLRNAPAVHWEVLRQDVTFAWCAIAHAPMLSVTVVLIAALGIGATTAAFSIADHALLKPLPFPESDRLVKVWQQTSGGTLEASPGNFRDWKAQASTFAGMAAFTTTSANLVGAGDPLRLEGARVSADLFGVLGVPPLVGRAVGPKDDLETAFATVVISERLWQSRFAADRRAIGTRIVLNDTPRVVIGVMPRTFQFPSRNVDFWIPLQLAPDAYVYGTQNPYLLTIARLRTGVSRDQAHAEMQQIGAEIARRVPNVNARIGVSVVYLRDEISPQARLLLWCLVAAAAALLSIACTNLANLLLARGVARQKELAIRSALGAGRHRLLRQMVTESTLLAAAGGIAGVAMAAASLPVVASLVPAGLPIGSMPGIDMRLLAAAALATMATALAFGLIPASRVARQSEADALHEGGRTVSGRRSERMRATLVVAQVGISVVLLVSSGLLLRAMLQVQGTSPGFDVDAVLTARTALPVPTYASVDRRHDFYDRVLDGVRALPGVSHAAYITGLPMVMRGSIWVVTVPERADLPPERRTASLRFVTPGFFATLGIPIQSGRDVSNSDTTRAPYVAVVSESFASRYWPGQDAVGRRFQVQGRERTVVGVVGNVRVRGLERDSEPQLYLPSRQVADGAVIGYTPKELVVKSSLAPAALVPAIRGIVARADPRQPVSDVQMLADIVDAETTPRRVQVRILGAFAALAFLLAGIGLHGLLAHSVAQRRREIGVRLALGADRRTILAMVMQRGLLLATLGVVTGGLVAAAAGRMLQTLLAGVSPTDAGTFAGAVALSLTMTVVGSLMPAVRAVRVDPIEVMRTE